MKLLLLARNGNKKPFCFLVTKGQSGKLLSEIMQRRQYRGSSHLWATHPSGSVGTKKTLQAQPRGNSCPNCHSEWSIFARADKHSPRYFMAIDWSVHLLLYQLIRLKKQFQIQWNVYVYDRFHIVVFMLFSTNYSHRDHVHLALHCIRKTIIYKAEWQVMACMLGPLITYMECRREIFWRFKG